MKKKNVKKQATNLILFFVFIGLYITVDNGCSSSENPPKSSTESTVENSEANPMDVEMINIDVASEGEPELTRNFYFIFDGSGSMKKPCSGMTRMQGAKSTMEKFIQSMPEDINVGLMVFDSTNIATGNVSTDDEIERYYQKKEIIPLGPINKQNFESAIINTVAGGGTPLAGCIYYATDRLIEQYKKQLGYGDYRIIIITDGQADYLKDASVYTYQYGIPMYTIGLCMNFEHPLKEFSLAYFDAQDFNQLGAALDDAVAETTDFDPQEFN